MAPPRHQGNSHRRHNSSKPSLPSTTLSSLLQEARKLKNQCERKAEDDANRVPLLERCAHALNQALAFNPSPEEEEDALFDLGEVYSLFARSIQARVHLMVGNVVSTKLKKINALNLEIECLSQAADYFRKSFEAFERISCKGGGASNVEAAVNSANALCDWADIASEMPCEKGGNATFSTLTELYTRAMERYSAALAQAPDDTEILTNFGDCMVRSAELAMTSPTEMNCVDKWASAKAFYERAMAAYEHACSNMDTRNGDDLAGLLQNWGAGLLSLAEMSPNLEEAVVAFRFAQEKLQSAGKLQLTNVHAFVTLGELSCKWAERLGKGSEQALHILENGISMGFEVALKIDSSCMDAVVGLAEAHLAAGKIASTLALHPIAQQHNQQSLNYYMKVMQVLETGGPCKMQFEEQCDVLYNIACAASLTCQEDLARKALLQLSHLDGLSPTELNADSDLENLKNTDWFVVLIQ